LIPIVEKVQTEGKTVPDLTKIYPGAAFRPKSEWDTGNKGLNDGMTKLLTTLKEICQKGRRCDSVKSV
jgi:hypothetical protein